MKHIALATAVAVLSYTGSAQEVERASTSEAWQQFQIQRGDGWHVAWNKATETPRAIWGPGLRVAAGPVDGVDDARRRAGRVLTDHAELLGVGESDLVESIGENVGRVWVFVYDQRFAGLEVIGGRADVRVHEAGGISMFGSRVVPIPKGFSIDPTIGMEFAEGVAYQHVSAAPGAERHNPRLVVWADVDGQMVTPVRLAWEVQVDARPQQLVYGKVWIDARTGRVLRFLDEVYYCGLGHAHLRGEPSRGGDAAHRLELAREVRPRRSSPFLDVTGTVMGYLRTGENAQSPGVNTPLPNVLVSIDGGGAAYTDANGDFSIPASGAAPVTVRVNFGTSRSLHARGGVVAAQGSAIQANATATPGGAPVTLQLAQSLTEFDLAQTTAYWHVDDINRWVRGILGNTSQMATASNIRTTVNIADTCNAYYSGNTINFYAAGSDPFAGYCYNTAFKTIVYHEWGHGLDARYGGISQTEGLSEGWGDILATYRADSPTVGLGFSSSGSVRSALNTRTYPVSSTSVHTQGQTWMGFAWAVRSNLRSSLGTTAGTQVAEQIVVGSIVADATNQPDAVREVFILDDDDANLNNGVPHYAELSSAAIARNLPFPELQLGTVTHTPLQSTTRQLEPRIVRVRAQPYLGSFTGANLVFDAGSGTQSRPMIVSGTDFVALLPGVSSPQSVSYHVVVNHSLGASVRLPDSGDHTYAVGQETVLFFDDMESGQGAWTHAQVQTQDDWQWGPPAGSSTDPSAAFSGQNAWGNDLGIGNYNGRYQNNVNNYLRAPTIDCRGHTGVTLKFRRWLGVESGQYDQAQVRVNGVIVWSNPYSTDLVDTSWTEMVIPIPQADNTLATIEWRLITDGGLTFSGWTIDDVRVFSFQSLPPPSLQFRASPAQIPLGGASVVTVQGTAGAPAAILLSTLPGPTPVLPGVVLEVGIPFVSVPLSLDAAGALQTTLPGSTDPASIGAIYYAQVLQIVSGTVDASNGMVFLFSN